MYHTPLAMVHALSLLTADPWTVVHDVPDHSSALLFRGSATMDDYWTDACCTLTHIGGVSSARVHSGFLRRYLDLRPGLPWDDPPSLVAGHSLGAALAMLYMWDVAHVLGPERVPDATLFAVPRIGNRAFVRAFDTLTEDRVPFVLQNTRDPVVHLPPGPVYQHSDRQRFFRGPMGGHGIPAYCAEVVRLQQHDPRIRDDRL